MKNKNFIYCENIFTKILNNEIGCEKIYEDKFVLAIKDINPQAKFHVLLLSKKKYINFEHFISYAENAEIIAYYKSIQEITNKCRGNFKLISNNGSKMGQEIFHFHTHILSNECSK